MTDPWKPDPDLKAAMEALYGPREINDGEAFLYHLKQNPTLLDPAPADRDAWGAAMHRRVDDEVHSCLRCGQRSQQAIVAETPDRPRFLDLCFDCAYWLRKHMDEAERGSW